MQIPKHIETEKGVYSITCNNLDECLVHFFQDEQLFGKRHIQN